MPQKSNKLLKPYETDASQIKGKPFNVVVPRSVSEAANTVRLNSSIIPRGAGTGFSGGVVPINGNETIIDMSKLNNILDFDEKRKTITIETGIILDELNNFLSHYNLEFPVNPSSHEVCTIGGMIATDAVGSRAIKYGKTSKYVDSIEVVNNKGEIKTISKAEISDYTGLEGITGLIVRAKLRLVERKSRSATLVAKDSIKEIIELTKNLKRDSRISMIEILGRQISEYLDLPAKYHLIVEFESDHGNLKDKEYQDLMKMRDKIYPILASKQYEKIEDPKVLTDRIEKLIEWLEQNKIPFFGHLGVGIIHPCFKDNKEHEELIQEMVNLVKRLHGEITGEHGIGILKKQFLDKSDRKLWLAVKKRCDEQNKFNPGKIL